MRLLLVAGIAALIGGCPGGRGDTRPEEPPPEDTVPAKRSAKELILDAVLDDVLNNPDLKVTREFYGTPGDKNLALVTNPDYGVPWPKDYQPNLPGWTVTRLEEGAKRDAKKSLLLGVRIDKYYQEDKERAKLFRSPVAVTILNAGGSGGVIGGCSVYYRPKQADGKWVVEFEGALDP